VIDGTGAAPLVDQTVLIENGVIREISRTASIPGGAQVMDLTGRTIIPGLVGMHDHLFYPTASGQGPALGAPPLYGEMGFSFPRLYLAAGVTSLRTTGSLEPYADLSLKKLIDTHQIPGPKLHITGPYLEGAGSFAPQLYELKDADDATRTVNYWMDQGVTSFKAYMNITRAELRAAIDEAHRRHLKVTGHLCSVTYPEAAELSIDDLEHGFFVNTQLDPGKKPDKCSETTGTPTLVAMKPGSAEATALIKLLVDRHVAITSTLPVFEQSVALHSPLNPKAMAVLTPQARESYLYLRNRTVQRASTPQAQQFAEAFRNDLGLERQFVAAGGLLLAGPDPTGNGGVIPGFGDLRELELLVEAGFTPVEAIKIGTMNGATYLGLFDHVGSIASGKNADLFIVKGNPASNIADVENVVVVFKDGVGYDSAKLLDSVKGRYGQY